VGAKSKYREKIMATVPQLIRFLLGLQGAVFVGCEIDAARDALVIRVRRRSHATPRCPECSQVLTGKITDHKKEWRHLDSISKQTFVVATIREGYCTKHGRRRERVPWAAPAARCTNAFDREVAALVQVANRTAVARVFGISWRTTGTIIKRVVAKLLPKDLLTGLRSIAIDETSYKRGHRYLTVVYCQLSGRVVWIGEGKSAKTLDEFFKLLSKKARARIKIVAMDMSGAFRKSVSNWVPNALIVFDRFHVVKLLLEAVDEVRRDICRPMSQKERAVIKGSRFALLRNPRHLKPKDIEAIRSVQQSNGKLARTYQLRVDFEGLWDCEYDYQAEEFLSRWTRAALLSRRKPLRRFANTVREHWDGILGYFRSFRQTTGPLEGMNYKIKLIIHKAFGFRSVPALMSMIHLCCSGIQIL
jgi:transposase